MKNNLNKEVQGFYFYKLDALRAIAALMVIGYHYVNWIETPNTSFHSSINYLLSFGGNGGFFGVMFFFILSGFLISYLLFQEKKKFGNIEVLKFYMRRVIRIWPLYYFTLLIGFVVYPFIRNSLGLEFQENANPFLYSVFGANFDIIYNNQYPNSGILGVQWSVSIEEQFYLIWPLIFLIVKKTYHLVFLFILLLVLSQLWVFENDTWELKYYHLFSNLRYLVFGGLLGWISVFYQDEILLRIESLNGFNRIIIYFIGILFCLFLFPFFESNFSTELFNFIAVLFFGYVILDNCFNSKIEYQSKVFKWLSSLGKISYGLYLLHMIVITFLINLFTDVDNYYFLFFIIIISTTSISYLSFNYFEKPIMRFRSYFVRKI